MNHGIVLIATEESHFKMNILFKINIKKIKLYQHMDLQVKVYKMS